MVSRGPWLNKLTVGPNEMPFLSGLDGPFDILENLMFRLAKSRTSNKTINAHLSGALSI